MADVTPSDASTGGDTIRDVPEPGSDSHGGDTIQAMPEPVPSLPATVLRKTLPPSSATSAPSKREQDPTPEEARPFVADPERRLNQYVLVKELGAGGMGSVWKGWDTKLTRWVAVKFLNTSDHESVKRFEREAQMAARLHHPNIAAVHEVNELKGLHYLVMDYIDGGSMSKTDLPVRRILEIFVKVCRAMDFAHRNHIIHRDLKPANIMLNKENEPFVTDFGLAKIQESESSLSVTGALLGTPAYMSPEQATGRIHDIDSQSDIYSLGATLYVLVARRLPFEGANTSALIYKVVHEDPIPPRQAEPTLPEAIERIILKAMSKEKAQRYATAGEIADDLERFLQDQPVEARGPGLGSRIAKGIRRHSTLYAALAVALIAGAVIAYLVLRPKPRPPGTTTTTNGGPVTSGDPMEPIKARLALSDFREATPQDVEEAKRVLSALPDAEAEKAAAWFRGQVDRVPDVAWPRRDWAAKKPEAQRLSDWCAALVAVGPALGARFDPLREKLTALQTRLAPVLAYRGRIRLKIAVWPSAELRSLQVGSEWVVKDGKKTGDLRIVGDNLATPMVLEDVEIGDFTFVLVHAEHGEVKRTIAGQGIENGKSYILSGSMAKPDSLKLGPSP